MSDPFVIKPATRSGVKALVGFYGMSGGGKTMSALLFARGLAGPTGKITLIDTENGRGSIFADIPEIGGYQVLDLDAPFTPDRYQQAIVTAEKASDVVVVDSMSHEWSGEGGVLDMQEAELFRMAKDDYAKRESCKMASWIKPKGSHKAMVQRLLRSKTALICCLRGEPKTHMVKGAAGEKNKVITDTFSSPLFDPRFIFEMLVNFEVIAKEGNGGFVIPRKITHPAVKNILPREDEQIGVKHGQLLAQWCANTSVTPGTATTTQKKAPESADALKAAKTELFGLLRGIAGSDKATQVAKINQWLIDEAVIDPTETVAELNAAQLASAIKKVKTKLNP